MDRCKMKKTVFALTSALAASAAIAVTTNTFYVGAGYAPDATHYTTVQAAFDAVPKNSADFYLIKIDAGTYREKVSIASKENVVVLGDAAHPENHVIQFDAASAKINPATGKGYGTDGSATFTIGNYCDNLEFVGITFDNCATRESLAATGQQAGQALAMLIHDYTGRQTFRKCRFLGYQDTLEPKTGICYFEDCYIEGEVDFIFAGAPSLFNRCELHCHSSRSKITAGSADAWRKVAFLFYRCRVTAPKGVSAALGRSWRSTANVWFVDCDYGDAINAGGWTKWNDKTGETTLREYGCRSNVVPNRPNGAGQWAEGILVTGSIDDFWTEFASFGYSDLRDILFASNDNGATKSKIFKPEIRPAVIKR